MPVMRRSQHPIRRFRLSRDPTITLADLADQVGTSKANLSRIENGHQEISEALLPKLADVTGIAPGVLRPDLARMFAREAAE